MKFKLNNTFTNELPADPDRSNTRRQVKEACYSYVDTRVPSSPSLLHYADEVGALIGLSQKDSETEEFLKIFSGAQKIEGSTPYAMCYGGHQFGHWAGQLGDGRAINLAEVEHNDKRWALQLKGSGATPYSRTADGLAVLRSSIREHLCSEAMHHLGVPSTRSLSLCLTGDEVLRDMMYDGNSAYEKGAVVCRVAPSFLRFGNFQIFASRDDLKNLRILSDYTIRHFYPEITDTTNNKYVALLKAVADRTLDMIIHWQRVGFVHGVMNTDNMSILGLTIDYGPYGWLEDYNPYWTPNTTDRQHKRYRYGNQPAMAHWNLFQLANALYPLVKDAAPFEAVLNQFQKDYYIAKEKMMCSKLGLATNHIDDTEFILSLEKTLEATETDMTIFYRLLSNVLTTDTTVTAIEKISSAFYDKDIADPIMNEWTSWFQKYIDRLAIEKRSDLDRKTAMDAVNPKYVLRNYMAQLAIDAADKGNYDMIDELYTLLKNPYSEQINSEKWFAKRPEWARHKVGCSMLSCSS